ncbi:hypothetical protein TNCV_906681 [Trichonephila clavipes]|nr:hypothetical protein TNCV_906681 [Trichonephila clavipes]
MRAKAFCAQLSIQCMSRCSGQVVSRRETVLSSQASLVLIYRPTESMKGRVNLAQPELEPRTCGVEAGCINYSVTGLRRPLQV